MISSTRRSHIATTGDTVLGRQTWGRKNGSLRWQQWKRHTAEGVGSLWAYRGVDRWSSRKARVTLNDAHGGHFTRMTIRARNNGETRTRTLRLARARRRLVLESIGSSTVRADQPGHDPVGVGSFRCDAKSPPMTRRSAPRLGGSSRHPCAQLLAPEPKPSTPRPVTAGTLSLWGLVEQVGYRRTLMVWVAPAPTALVARARTFIALGIFLRL